MINYDKLIVKPVKYSFKTGEDIDVNIENLNLKPDSNVSINLNIVEDDYTEFAYQAGNVIHSAGENHKVRIQSTSDLKTGIYLIAQINISEDNNGIPNIYSITAETFGNIIIEVIDPDNTEKTEQELSNLYMQILQNREYEFNKGIGNGSKTFEACIFIKNCKITRQMRIGQYEIIPWNGLECNDKLESLQDFLTQNGLNILKNTTDTLNRCKNDQPTAIIHFPKVKGDNIDIVSEIVENESMMLCDLLAVLRDGYPSIYGSLLFDRDTNETFFKIYKQFYRGNLLGGLFSGEDPKFIKQCMNKLKNDDKVQLYLELYNEANKERHIELLYFRLWNILEIIAGSKGYEGQVKKDWDGRSGKDWNGTPIRDNKKLKIKHKKELVFELLRIIFNHKNISKDFFAQNIQQGSIPEMIPIWYQHRNCVVHGGGCFPSDTTFCKSSNCKSAHDEIINIRGERNPSTDEYLTGLRETVKIVIDYELK